MFIEKLALQNFRNFKNKVFSFAETTIILGPNGMGKTSIIEGVSLISTGVSFRANKIEEMVRLGVELGRVKSKVLVGEEKEELQLEVMVNRGEVQGKRTQRRLYSVNEVRRRKKDFAGKFQTVIFRPEDLRLIEGSPGRRRSFMNTALSGVDTSYGVALYTYEQALKRRNKLLWAVREGEQQRQVLSYWNMLVVKHGQVLQKKRREFFDFLLTVKFPFKFEVVYIPSEISAQRLEAYESREIASGYTLVGPHKDDLMVKFKMKGEKDLVDLAAYGSRGQQRLGVLWLKLGEMVFIRERKTEQPVLLLDDIMSELDDESRAMVLGLIGKQQIIITSADRGLVEEIKKKDDEVRVIKLST